MSRTAQLEPRWLIGLLVLWASRELHAQSRSLGWYAICPMLKGGIPTGQRQSYEPTGYSGFELERVGKLIDALPDAQRLAVCWYFRVGMRDAIEAQYPMHHNSRMDSLKRALRGMEALFDDRRRVATGVAA